MRWVMLGSALTLILSGCGSSARLAARSAGDATMFGPTRMRIHPIFTQVKDWTGDGKPDGVEALIEFQDRFGDPTKATGQAMFELFDYRPYNPDPRGQRVTGPWTGSLNSVDEQRTRWNRTLSTYSFRLPFEGVSESRNYVLTAAFDRAAEQDQASRFFDRIVIEASQRTAPAAAPETDSAAPAAAGAVSDPNAASPATRPAAP